MKANGADLAYVTVQLIDENGILNMWESKDITVQVQGDIVLQGFGSAAPQGGGNYFDNVWPTYDGRVLAVVRAKFTKGKGQLTFTAPDCKAITVDFKVV